MEVTFDGCVDHALGLLPPDLQAAFATDPIGVLRQSLSLKVHAVDQLTDSRSDGGACDGMSFLQDGVILYAPTPYSRRENFTLAHELGHWLVDQAEAIYDWLADQREPERMLETLCDRIAQRLLLPATIVRTVVGVGPVRARHLVDLYAASAGSRPVCAIALASELPALGAVVIVDHASEQVTFASVRPDPYRGWPTVFPWRDQPVPDGHPLKSLRAGRAITRKTFWRTPWGEQQEYYVDAVTDEKRTMAVFSAIDLWNAERLHLDAPRDFLERPQLEIYCCGMARQVRGYPCQDCRQPYCPSCGRCRCERMADKEVLCAGTCFMKFQPHLLKNGLCEECHG